MHDGFPTHIASVHVPNGGTAVSEIFDSEDDNSTEIDGLESLLPYNIENMDLSDDSEYNN